ncbi:MAG: alpha/beta hydrolase [Clostridiales bacterium]|nr:alpha/beta hydrolase [Clostridiales bacterium]
MNANILCRGDENSPCIYLMGGEPIKLPAWRDLWVIQVQGADWNRDFSPWPAPKVFSKGEDFSGGGDDYLATLGRIIPQWEGEWGIKPLWRGIAGYSLAGLFSLYAMTKTGLFSRCGCFSGSLWFPGWTEYLRKSDFIGPPECLCFSLGDQESNTRNPMLSSIAEKTEETLAYLKSKNIPCIFSWHPGGHFQHVDQRILSGLEAMLHFQKKN